MIKIENLFYGYEGNRGQILHDISMEIEPGKYVGVIGPNGSGKTTFVRHLNGLLTPARGNVWVDGMNTRDAAAVQDIRQRVGMVFQNPDDQIVGMSVEEDVAFGPGNLRVSPVEIRRRVEESLAMVGMMKDAERSPHTLSNGEKQRLAIAGVLAMNPTYLVLDEPTTYLDPSARERVLEVIGRLNQQGIGIVHVSHDMDELSRADEIIVFNEGRLSLAGSPSKVFTQVETLRGIGVGIPIITEMMWRLRQAGVDVRTDIFSVEDACREVAALISRWAGSHGISDRPPYAM